MLGSLSLRSSCAHIRHRRGYQNGVSPMKNLTGFKAILMLTVIFIALFLFVMYFGPPG